MNCGLLGMFEFVVTRLGKLVETYSALVKDEPHLTKLKRRLQKRFPETKGYEIETRRTP